jgi:hypothetical protein
MDWSTVTAWAEISGAFGVIASLRPSRFLTK